MGKYTIIRKDEKTQYSYSEKSIVKCKKCGGEELEGTKFCSVCGSEIFNEEKIVKVKKIEINKTENKESKEEEYKEPKWAYYLCYLFLFGLVIYILFFEKGFSNP